MHDTKNKDPPDVFEDQAQALLVKFLDGEIIALEPTYDSQMRCHYAAAEAIVGEAAKVESILLKLTHEKILEQKFFDKVISCPKCGSAELSFRYCCPMCKSFNIKKSSLIEHVKCGYMDLEERFTKESSLICPKCHGELKNPDVDYRKAGIWCACNDCGKNFDIPSTQHYCTRCHSISTFEDALIKDIYSYVLSADAKSKMSLTASMITPIREFLTLEGFKVEVPSFLTGKSGARHSFSLAAYDPASNEVTVIDLATSTDGSVSEQPVIALFVKTFDVSHVKALIVAIPKLSENARKMADYYNIKTVEAKTQAEAVAALREKLQ